MATIQEQLEFIKFMRDAALAGESKYGILARHTIAQAALESKWGQAKIGNFNYFGMKYAPKTHSLQSKSVDVTTTEWIDGVQRILVQTFADYDSLQSAVNDYCWLLTARLPYRDWFAKFKATGDLGQFLLDLATVYSTSNPILYKTVVLNIANSNVMKRGLVGA